MNRNSSAPAGLLTVLLLFGLLVTPIPYVREQPGATYDTLGKVDNQPLVEVAETATYRQYKTDGEILMLTVFEWGGPLGPLPFGDAMRAVFNPAIHVVPSKFLYPENVSRDDLKEQGATQFVSSQSQAVAAALTALNIPISTRLVVQQVSAGTPAAGKLAAADVLTTIDSKLVNDFDSLDEILKTLRPNQTIEVGVLRAGKPLTYKLKLGTRDKDKPLIGVIVMIEFYGPMSVKIQLDNVGGPSAGLAFALSIYDKLTPGALLKNRTVAVTGTIDQAGNVGAIGGLPQKISAAYDAGARLLLIPPDNCADVPDFAPSDLQVVPVPTLQDAVNVLKASSTANYPRCPA